MVSTCGLISYHKLDGNVCDSFGINHGTVCCPTFTTCGIIMCGSVHTASFLRTITLDIENDYDFTLCEPWSISFWQKSIDGGARFYWDKRTGAGDGYLAYLRFTRPTMFVDTASCGAFERISSISANDGCWHTGIF